MPRAAPGSTRGWLDGRDRPGSNPTQRDPKTETTHVEALETRSPDAGSIPAASTILLVVDGHLDDQGGRLIMSGNRTRR